MESQLLGKSLSMPLKIIIWLLSFYIAWNLIPQGYLKLTLDPSTVQFFESLQLPRVALIGSGIVEVVGSISLFFPPVSFYGALPIVAVMLAATYYNGGLITTILMGLFALIISIITRPKFLRKKIEITKISV